MAGTRRHESRNIIGHVKGVGDMYSLASWAADQFDPGLSWNDVDWIKDRWGGKLIIEGILDPGDAEKAVRSGADAIVFSNYCGRQLDGAPSSISVLAEIVAAVGKQIEVHFDGGIRSGQDVLKALCLGAKGEAGVTETLKIIKKELDTTMALCVERLVTDLGHHILLDPPDL